MNRVKLPICPWNIWYVLGRVPPTMTSTPWMPFVTRPTNSPMAVPRSMLYLQRYQESSNKMGWDGIDG